MNRQVEDLGFTVAIDVSATGEDLDREVSDSAVTGVQRKGGAEERSKANASENGPPPINLGLDSEECSVQ